MYPGSRLHESGPGPLEAEVAMFADQTRTVLILPQALLDRARVFAGEATSQLKRMVSLQMVLRALIDEGLKQHGGRGVLANAVDPGWVRTDMGGPSAPRSVQQGGETTVWLATLPDDGPTGGFFRDKRAIDW